MAFKHLHLLAVVLTVVFFVIRSGGLLFGWQALANRGVRSLHHAVDLVVLVSALGLCYYLTQWPFYNSAWVTAKLFGLLAYMGLAAYGLKRSNFIAVALAAACLAYTAWVAVNKVPFPGF